MQLEGRKIVVTGGAGGIGRAVLGRLADNGAQLAALDVDEGALEALAEQFPDVHRVAGDISTAEGAAAAVGHCIEELGDLDALVNNAGIVDDSLLVRLSPQGLLLHEPEVWDRVIATNLSSVFYATRICVAQMVRRRTRGVIVNVGSISAAGNEGQSAYAAAKAGIEALTVTWAKELAAHRIRVAGIAPGYTRTRLPLESMSEGALKEVEAKTPVRRLAEPEEIAHGILFILENDFFSGRMLRLDGGLRY